MKAILCVLALMPTVASAEVWVDASGKKSIRADYAGVTENSVLLRGHGSGTHLVAVPFDRLSRASLVLLAKHMASEITSGHPTLTPEPEGEQNSAAQKIVAVAKQIQESKDPRLRATLDGLELKVRATVRNVRGGDTRSVWITVSNVRPSPMAGDIVVDFRSLKTQELAKAVRLNLGQTIWVVFRLKADDRKHERIRVPKHAVGFSADFVAWGTVDG